MRILQFQAENFKKLKVVSFSPDKNKVLISGANEQGKSSILDAVQVALCGKDSLKKIPEPIRKGEKTGSIQIALGDEEPCYVVTRTFTAKDSYLTIENKEGARYNSPQKILDELFNKKTIDPSDFLSLDDEKQLKLLKEIADIPIDLDKLEEQKKLIYDERTIVNREIKGSEMLLATLHKPSPNLPTVEIDGAILLDEIEEANSIIESNNEKRAELKELANEFNKLKSEKEKLEQMLKEINEKLEVKQKEGKQLKAIVEELIDPDVSELFTKLKNLQHTNNLIQEANEYRKVEKQLLLKKQESEKLSAKLIEIDNEKQEAIKNAKFPIAGLGFADNGITYKGVPFSQSSQEERIRVSLAIAMAQNPTLRVILIRDASLLDSKNLKVIEQIAEEKDYQVWLEKVDESGKVGIMIEDGEIKCQEDKEIKIPSFKEQVSKTSSKKKQSSVSELNFERGENK